MLVLLLQPCSKCRTSLLQQHIKEKRPMHVQVTRQLFTEFVKQLIHWFTSNQQKENPETMALLDAILDGLVDPENGSLRSFYQPQLFHELHGKLTPLRSLNHHLAVVYLGF